MLDKLQEYNYKLRQGKGFVSNCLVIVRLKIIEVKIVTKYSFAFLVKTRTRCFLLKHKMYGANIDLKNKNKWD